VADNMTRAQRSATMSRIRRKHTLIELRVRELLSGSGARYRLHADWLPGKPDIAFTSHRIAIFIDGDFWHGWQFTRWAHKLGPYWRKKIEGNRRRDRRCHALLRARGWKVIRLWEHLIKEDPERCLHVIHAALRTQFGSTGKYRLSTSSGGVRRLGDRVTAVRT
jgi:DNA mismatch endonuclease, patch repair protein